MSDLYLASRSPRRRDLLKQIGVRFEPLLLRLSQPRGPDVGEQRHAGESPADYVERVARDKAQAGASALALRSLRVLPVLTADTVVILDDDILDKPGDASQAAALLRRLAERTHEVRTCVVVATGGTSATRLLCAMSVSRVTFGPISDAQIAQYCASGEPYDKAGGYAIQGLAAVFARHLEGSYSGVMGLPLFETARLLRQAGVPVL